MQKIALELRQCVSLTITFALTVTVTVTVTVTTAALYIAAPGYK